MTSRGQKRKTRASVDDDAKTGDKKRCVENKQGRQTRNSQSRMMDIEPVPAKKKRRLPIRMVITPGYVASTMKDCPDGWTKCRCLRDSDHWAYILSGFEDVKWSEKAHLGLEITDDTGIVTKIVT